MRSLTCKVMFRFHPSPLLDFPVWAPVVPPHQVCGPCKPTPNIFSGSVGTWSPISFGLDKPILKHETWDWHLFTTYTPLGSTTPGHSSGVMVPSPPWSRATPRPGSCLLGRGARMAPVHTWSTRWRRQRGPKMARRWRKRRYQESQDGVPNLEVLHSLAGTKHTFATPGPLVTKNPSPGSPWQGLDLLPLRRGLGPFTKPGCCCLFWPGFLGILECEAALQGFRHVPTI